MATRCQAHARLSCRVAALLLATVAQLVLLPSHRMAWATEAAHADAFYQFFRTDTQMIEDYLRFDVAGTLTDGHLHLCVNPHVDTFVLRDADISWRVMLNFAGGTMDGERDISSEAIYDESTGMVTLPASYAGSQVSFVAQLPWTHPAHELVRYWGSASAPRQALDRTDGRRTLLPQSVGDISAGMTYPIRNVTSDATGSHSPWMLGKDYDTHNLAALCGYPEMEGRYGFFVAFQKNNCALFELLDAVPGRPGSDGVVTTDYGDVIERRLAGQSWVSADCVEEVSNGREIFFVLEDAGSWVRVDAIEGAVLHCTFRLSVDGPGGTNYQDVMGKFDLEMPYGRLHVEKRSGCPSITDGNSSYSLAGATYEVYGDVACTQPVGMLVTDEQGHATLENLVAGTYWVRETIAPAGYALDQTTYEVALRPGASTTVGGEATYDMPLHAVVDLTIQKADAQGMGTAQGDALLVGTKMRIDYYDGLYDESVSLPKQATRSWTVSSADLGGDIVAARLGDARCAREGDACYELDDAQVLPLGTIAIREAKAPDGYLLSDTTTHLLKVIADHNAPGGARIERLGSWSPNFHRADSLNLAIEDEVVRGGVRLGKVDAQSLRHLPQGAARLGGAELAIELVSDRPVMVDGVSYARGEVVMTVPLADDGIGQTEADALPYGTYVAYEVSAPEGYEPRPRDQWSKTFSIREPGVIVDLSTEDDSVPDQVKRGDLRFTKVAERSMRRLAGVPFVISSDTTGESHVVVTDENGTVSTAASWTPHTHRTNANDDAAREAGGTWQLVDDGTLDPDAGIWFDGYADVVVDPDDGLGALPYDNYTVTELPAPANDGLALVSFSVTVRRPDVAIDCGTIIDRPAPSIATTLTDVANGTHTSAPADLVTLRDSVAYAALTPGAAYELRGSLRLLDEDGGSTLPLTDSDGEPVVAHTQFVATEPDGTATVEFTFDASDLAGRSVVAFETLSSQGGVIATHEDAGDANQAVSFAALETVLSEAGSKLVSGTGNTSVVDSVRYRGLTPGTAYTILGMLIDKDSGNPALSSAGMPLRGGTTFVATESEGMVDVRFDFDASDLAGHTLVASEALTTGETAIVVHADLDNAAQTVVVPTISTTAIVADSEAHEARATSDTIIVDTVSYHNLIPGETYELVTTVLDLTTGDMAIGGSDTPAMHVTFAAPEADGSIEISVPLDARELAGSDVVVFERLYHEGRLIARHEDPDSQEQRVSFPLIRTEARDAISGTHTMTATADGRIVDTVSYHNLTPGIEYVLTGTLHRRTDDGRDGGIVSDANGHNSAAAMTFVPAERDGSISLAFDVDCDTLAGADLVAFEQLVRHDIGIVAEHADIRSAEQSVTVSDRPTPPHALPRTGDLTGGILPVSLVALAALLLGHVVRRLSDRQRTHGHSRAHRP